MATVQDPPISDIAAWITDVLARQQPRTGTQRDPRPPSFNPFVGPMAGPPGQDAPDVLRQPGEGMFPSVPDPIADALSEFAERVNPPPQGYLLPRQPVSRGIGSDAVAARNQPAVPRLAPRGGIGSDAVAAPQQPPLRHHGPLPPFDMTVTPAGPDPDAIMRGAQAAAASGPTGSIQPPSMVPRGMPGPTIMDRIGAGLAGLSGPKALAQHRAAGDRTDSRNATYDALLQRGASDELARAMALNPRQFARVLPSIFAPNRKVVNNRLVDTRTGAVIADLSDPSFRALPANSAGVLNERTGEVSTLPGGGSRTAGAPSGYEWVDPADRSLGLRAIAGGPATRIPAETAGRIAMMRAARPGVEEARKVYERHWGIPDGWRQFWANVPMVGDVGKFSGEQGLAARNIRAAVESALRAMTGAAAPEEEVSRYAEIFTPNIRDSIESAKQKINLLEAFMQRAEQIVTQGRTPTPSAPGDTAPGDAGWTDLAPGVRIRELQ